MKSEVIKINKIKEESSWTSSMSSSDSSFVIPDLYDEAIKLGEEEEKFYTMIDCVGHTRFYKRMSEGFFAMAFGYSPPYEMYEKPTKLSEVEIQNIFTDYRAHGRYRSSELTKEEYEEEIKCSNALIAK